MDLPHELLISVFVVLGAIVMLSVLFPDLMNRAVAERQSRNDVIVTLPPAPQIAVAKTGSGYVYDVKAALVGEYKGDYHEGAAGKIDVEAFVTFKGQTARATIEDKGHFSVSKDNEGKSGFSIAASVSIISDEPPMREVSSPYDNVVRERETLILDKSFALKLEKTGESLLGKIPVFGNGICWASFIATCGKETKLARLRECGEEYDCKTEINMCGGSLNIGIKSIDCGNGAAIVASAKNGAVTEHGEEMYISFWEKTQEPSCADQARNYNELATTCYGDFLGEYTMNVRLPGENA